MNPHTALDAEKRGGIEHAQHEIVLLLSQRGILVQHVVEIAEVGKADAGGLDRRVHAAGARFVERLPQVERIGHGIEHRFGRDVSFVRMQRG